VTGAAVVATAWLEDEGEEGIRGEGAVEGMAAGLASTAQAAVGDGIGVTAAEVGVKTVAWCSLSLLLL
jgi:hypothetical protein